MSTVFVGVSPKNPRRKAIIFAFGASSMATVSGGVVSFNRLISCQLAVFQKTMYSFPQLIRAAPSEENLRSQGFGDEWRTAMLLLDFTSNTVIVPLTSPTVAKEPPSGEKARCRTLRGS